MVEEEEEEEGPKRLGPCKVGWAEGIGLGGGPVKGNGRVDRNLWKLEGRMESVFVELGGFCGGELGATGEGCFGGGLGVGLAGVACGSRAWGLALVVALGGAGLMKREEVSRLGGFHWGMGGLMSGSCGGEGSGLSGKRGSSGEEWMESGSKGELLKL